MPLVIRKFTFLLNSVMEEVFRSLTKVKVPIQQCINTPLQAKILHSKSYLSESAEVISAKCTCTSTCYAEKLPLYLIYHHIVHD